MKRKLICKVGPGWCGAVAGMMAIYGLRHNPHVKWNMALTKSLLRGLKKSRVIMGFGKRGRHSKQTLKKVVLTPTMQLQASKLMGSIRGAQWKHFSNERYLLYGQRKL